MKKVLFNLLLLMSAFTIKSKNEIVRSTYSQAIEYKPIRLSQARTQENDGSMVNHFYKEEPISATKEEFDKANAQFQKAQKDFRSGRMFSMTTVNNSPVYSIDNKVVTEKEYKKAKEKYDKAQTLVFSGPAVIQKGSLYYKYQPKKEITEQEFNTIYNTIRTVDLQKEKGDVINQLNKTDADLGALYRKDLNTQLEYINKSLDELNKEIESQSALTPKKQK